MRKLFTRCKDEVNWLQPQGGELRAAYGERVARWIDIFTEDMASFCEALLGAYFYGPEIAPEQASPEHWRWRFVSSFSATKGEAAKQWLKDGER